ncbi:signal recognition particle protein [Kerstersia gyiorum]|jgi:signal recognition particle subunit SRP54|uniref:Signal recognition particle protein n=1 Tax=Kerstersia gyiorum TaxID=206506 RepID=A0A171KRL8_9BURK|nr:signal recognition particle protein [Kerstersia gyiorum]AZV92611.1 signal recognition particle protein [Bordetella sp. J329]MCO7641242.1 signal recognition particle protein [Pseudomonas sp. S 311-6]KAB0542551.1 signal recognition particle protein [Kerstersia gyiorum]KKO71535.1 signal recognition particle [Kerstersia gyiorum]MCH4271898.1 signal recognition particle protein [Kerstersia gyiorum]
MLDNLTQRLSRVVKTLRGEARLTEANTQEMLREVRLALLEADVALPVVKDFVSRVKERALGADVADSLNPGQALVGVVHKVLTELMGGDLGTEAGELSLAVQPPAVILMAGLQGAGKTTTTGKLARWLAEGGHTHGGRKTGKKKVLVVSADVYRPAAIEQLRTVAEQAGIDWLPSDPSQKPLDIANNAVDHARRHHYDVLILDTAGRLGIDEAMMQEIKALHAAVSPVETLFVVDAMQGQDAVNTAQAFANALPLTGVVLTKLDGDARGGAALSVRHVTGKPLKFVGVSEKLDGLEPFHPERMAQRVLGMGDIVSLVEQAQKNIDIAEAQKLASKIKSGDKFDLNDFREQLLQVRKLGDMGSLLEKLPAQFQAAAGQLQGGQAEKQLRRTEGILNSMTPQERAKPELLKASRKRRIAAGAGVPVQEVNRLLNQFEQMQGMMKQMKKGGMAKMMRAMGGLKGLGRFGGLR